MRVKLGEAQHIADCCQRVAHMLRHAYAFTAICLLFEIKCGSMMTTIEGNGLQ